MNTSAGDQHQVKIEEHEQAAHQKRNWVRLTFDCNDHCVFCLDAHAHNGTNRDRNEVKEQILDGRRKGAQRLILSGGEPTIHPNYVDFIRLGAMAGYEKIQTVTNGRMFAYREFLIRCLDAGLGEITFSIHGPNARIHDALVGTKGAFEQEVQGLKYALADGRPIVNIDVCVNRGNVKQLPALLKKFTDMGVKEYDLLHVIPFGNAYTEGRETLFYDLEKMRPYLLEAFAYSKKPGIHIWLNRFPPQHLEGYEHLIQDPYKLNDEVRGRKEEYGLLLEEGEPLDCRAPHRCQFCYMEPLCDTLDEVRATVNDRAFSVVRVDTTFAARMPEVYGGDPASRQRSESRKSQEEQEAEAFKQEAKQSRVRLPLFRGGQKPSYAPPPQLAKEASASTVWVIAPSVEEALAAIKRYPDVPELDLEVADIDGLVAAIEPGTNPSEATLAGKRITRIRVTEPAQATELLADGYSYEVMVELSQRTESWLRELSVAPSRLALIAPTYERLTESQDYDVDVQAFFADFRHRQVPVEGVPNCVLGREGRARPPMLDTSMMLPNGHLEIFHYARRYIIDRFWTKSLRCKKCVYNESCRGMHINYVRAHGYGQMQPVAPAPAQVG